MPGFTRRLKLNERQPVSFHLGHAVSSLASASFDLPRLSLM